MVWGEIKPLLFVKYISEGAFSRSQEIGVTNIGLVIHASDAYQKPNLKMGLDEFEFEPC